MTIDFGAVPNETATALTLTAAKSAGGGTVIGAASDATIAAVLGFKEWA